MAVRVKSCGGGGLSSSDVTASSAQVLAGYSTLTTDSNDEVMQGSIPTYNWDTYISPLHFIATSANVTLYIYKFGDPQSVNVEISRDNCTTWSSYTPVVDRLTLTNAGDTVYFRGNNPNGFNYDMTDYWFFVAYNGTVKVLGNVMSLIDNGTNTCKTLPCDHCFNHLFSGCGSSLTTAPELPATTLTEWCYYKMFSGCTLLTTAPKLPATNLARSCYCKMFDGCTGLVIPPALSATTLAGSCYESMFTGCTSLSYVPSIPVYTSPVFYDLFNGCTSLNISSTPTAECTKEWRIPATGVSTSNYTSYRTFKDCPGTRSSGEDLSVPTNSYVVYYVVNDPIS